LSVWKDLIQADNHSNHLRQYNVVAFIQTCIAIHSPEKPGGFSYASFSKITIKGTP